eukprot:103209_1
MQEPVSFLTVHSARVHATAYEKRHRSSDGPTLEGILPSPPVYESHPFSSGRAPDADNALGQKLNERDKWLRQKTDLARKHENLHNKRMYNIWRYQRAYSQHYKDVHGARLEDLLKSKRFREVAPRRRQRRSGVPNVTNIGVRRQPGGLEISPFSCAAVRTIPGHASAPTAVRHRLYDLATDELVTEIARNMERLTTGQADMYSQLMARFKNRSRSAPSHFTGLSKELLTPSEFRLFIRDLGFRITRKQSKTLFKKFDLNNDGFLTFREFIVSITSNDYPNANSFRLFHKDDDVDTTAIMGTRAFQMATRAKERPVSPLLDRVPESLRAVPRTVDDTIDLLRSKLSGLISNHGDLTRQLVKLFSRVAPPTARNIRIKGLDVEGLRRMIRYFGLIHSEEHME